MFFKNTLKITKIILINLLIFFLTFVTFELFLGTWFKNNFKYKLSSERNINRVYKFDFEYHKGISHYIKNNYGFRIKNDDINFDPSTIDIVFAGGSTINQKFINYDDSIVGILANKNKNLKMANSGVDGMSIKGHINSFKFWFNKIKNLKPKYFIYVLGINDRYLIEKYAFRDHVDNLEESNFRGNLREYLESNSFFYTHSRKLKSLLYLKYKLEIGTKKVKLNHVYLDRNKNEFISYEEIEKNFMKLNKNKKIKYLEFERWYLSQLHILTDLVYNVGALPIFITQTTGYGHSFESFIVAKTIIKHCDINKLLCLNLAKDLNLKYEDFYDESHLNITGSKKMAEYINTNISIF
jgi:hypothetical protein